MFCSFEFNIIYFSLYDQEKFVPMQPYHVKSMSSSQPALSSWPCAFPEGDGVRKGKVLVDPEVQTDFYHGCALGDM